ncbi:MAG: hypothetical protein HDP34_01030 [Clostridia bacterium]|nr:hypothetical protein [Clostridia bacterium]
MKKKILSCLVAVFALVAANFCMGFELVSYDETKYCGSGSFTDESETIYYSTKETASYSMKGDVPEYYRLTDNSGCAVIAGTVLIGYYDRFCEELVPNYKTYVKIGTAIKYRGESFEIKAVMEELYTLMETDSSTGGTTYNGFHKGMKSYVNSHGYSYATEDLGNLDFNKYKSAVENNKPVALFLDNYSFAVTGEDNGSYEVIKSHHSTIAHVVVGCGYKVDTYYNANGQVISTRTYLKVATGLDQYRIGYLCLDGKSGIDRANSIIIQ